MRWLKTIFWVLLFAVVGLTAIGFVLPTAFDIARSTVLVVPPARIHELVGDLDRWPEWSPWEESDPTIVITPGSKRTGIGAGQSWSGESGSGSLTFTRSSPEEGLVYDLAFEGFEGRTEGYVTYAPAEGATRVTWGMRGDVGDNFFGRYFIVLMKHMVPPMFDRGLERLTEALK